MNSKLILLEYQIEYVRSKLYKTLLNKGLSDTKVINYSHELDKLLNEYMSVSLHLAKAA